MAQYTGKWFLTAPPSDHIQSETLFQTSQDHTRGVNGPASRLHSSTGSCLYLCLFVRSSSFTGERWQFPTTLARLGAQRDFLALATLALSTQPPMFTRWQILLRGRVGKTEYMCLDICKEELLLFKGSKGDGKCCNLFDMFHLVTAALIGCWQSVSKRQSSPREVLTWKIVDKRFRGLKSISGEPSPPKARALAGLMAECRRITFFIRSPFVHSSSTSWSTLLGSDGWERQDVVVGLVRLSVFCNKPYKQIARQGHHPPSHQSCCSALTRQLHFGVSPKKDSKNLVWFGCS